MEEEDDFGLSAAFTNAFSGLSARKFKIGSAGARASPKGGPKPVRRAAGPASDAPPTAAAGAASAPTAAPVGVFSAAPPPPVVLPPQTWTLPLKPEAAPVPTPATARPSSASSTKSPLSTAGAGLLNGSGVAAAAAAGTGGGSGGSSLGKGGFTAAPAGFSPPGEASASMEAEPADDFGGRKTFTFSPGFLMPKRNGKKAPKRVPEAFTAAAAASPPPAASASASVPAASASASVPAASASATAAAAAAAAAFSAAAAAASSAPGPLPEPSQPQPPPPAAVSSTASPASSPRPQTALPPLSPSAEAERKRALEEARVMFAAKEFAGAHKRFSDALAIRGGDAPTLSNRGACAMMLGRLVDAVGDCGRASDADPTYAPAYLRAARAHLALGELTSALSAALAGAAAADASAAGSKSREPARELVAVLQRCKALVDKAGGVAVSCSAALGAGGAVAAAAEGRIEATLREVAALREAHPVETRSCLHLAAAAVRLLALQRRGEGAAAMALEALPPCLLGSNEALACRESPSRAAQELAFQAALARWGVEDSEGARALLSAVALAGGGAHEAAVELARLLEAAEACKRRGNERFAAKEYGEALRWYKAALGALAPKEEGEEGSASPSASGSATCSAAWGTVAPAAARASLHSNVAAAHASLEEHEAAHAAAGAAVGEVREHSKALLRRARAGVKLGRLAEAEADFLRVVELVRGGQLRTPKSGRTEASLGELGGELEEVLNLASDANELAIKKSYRKMALETHPDKGGDAEKFKKVSEAYETLSDPQKRAGHDADIMRAAGGGRQHGFSHGGGFGGFGGFGFGAGFGRR